MRRVPWVLLGMSCGRVGFDARDDAVVETGFGQPVPLSALNSSNADDDPTLTSDLLEIIFDSTRDRMPGDLYHSTRPTRDAPWSVPVVISELSSDSDEDAPCLSPDGLTLTFASNRPGGLGGNDLYITTRPDRDAPWAAPVRIAELASTADDEDLSLVSGSLFGIFASDRGGTYDLYEAKRASEASTWQLRRMTELSAIADKRDPALTASGTTLLFSNTADIFIARRDSTDVLFQEAFPFDAVNTAVTERDPWVSADEKTVVFVRGDGEDRDLYIVER